MYVFAGGDGIKALNDLFVLKLNSFNEGWNKLTTKGNAPTPRGYHTSNLIGSKVVVYGGSDGQEWWYIEFIIALAMFMY